MSVTPELPIASGVQGSLLETGSFVELALTSVRRLRGGLLGGLEGGGCVPSGVGRLAVALMGCTASRGSPLMRLLCFCRSEAVVLWSVDRNMGKENQLKTTRPSVVQGAEGMGLYHRPCSAESTGVPRPDPSARLRAGV